MVYTLARQDLSILVPLIEECSLLQDDFVNSDYDGSQITIQDRCNKLLHKVQKFKSTSTSPSCHHAENVGKLFDDEETLEIIKTKKGPYSRGDIQIVLNSLVKLEGYCLAILKNSSSTMKNVLGK